MSVLERQWNPAYIAVDRMQSHLLSIPEHHRPTVARVDTLSEILENPLFHHPHPPIEIWSDFDGVANHALAGDKDPNRWFAFREIASHARNVHIVTMRYRLPLGFLNALRDPEDHRYHHLGYNMPLMSDELETRITNVLRHKNPHCTVDFHYGVGKLFSGEAFGKFSASVEKDLKEKTPVVLLGSSMFDRRRWNKLMASLLEHEVKDFSQLYYFDTGRLFI